MTVRLPLVSPDRWFDTVTPYVSWMYGGVAAVVWGVVVLAAASSLEGNGERFAASTAGIFAPGNWLALAGCWLVLKLLHEISHGVVCKRYGGTVREAGVLFILLFPAAYVDVTSCWRFPSRWQRIHTAVAGMYAELFVAAVAALAWSHLPPGPAAELCAKVVVMASLSTILFNANPLMRFDGYYVLSDLLQIPNLYPRGQQRLRRWVRRFLLGLDVPPDNDSNRVRCVTAIYGMATFGWRILVCAGLAISASALFAGAGVVIAIGGVAAWLLAPAVRAVKYLWCGNGREKPRLGRFAWSVSLLAVLVVVPLGTVPWLGARSAPAIVEHAPLTVVRAGSPGFVTAVRVSNGQIVEAGDELIVLENRQLEEELADLELGIQQLDLKRRSLATSHRMAELQAHDEHRAALQKQRAEKLVQVQRLTVRAPRAGQVLARELPRLTGTYLEEGDVLLTLAEAAHKELKISVAQPDVDPFSANLGTVVRVRLPGAGRLHGTLTELAPRADLEPAHPALTAALGGPLPVRADDNREADHGLNQPVYELFAPRLTGTVTLDSDQAARVRAGQRGVVSLTAYRESVGGFLYRAATDWVRRRVKRAFHTS
jgi:putative peptide zinc metalloprotease protein